MKPHIHNDREDSPNSECRPVRACKSCKAPYIWLKHARTSKRAPINAEPSEDGNILIQGDAYIIVTHPGILAKGTPLHTNHFMTCQHRDEWKAKRTKA